MEKFSGYTRKRLRIISEKYSSFSRSVLGATATQEDLRSLFTAEDWLDLFMTYYFSFISGKGVSWDKLLKKFISRHKHEIYTMYDFRFEEDKKILKDSFVRLVNEMIREGGTRHKEIISKYIDSFLTGKIIDREYASWVYRDMVDYLTEAKGQFCAGIEPTSFVGYLCSLREDIYDEKSGEIIGYIVSDWIKVGKRLIETIQGMTGGEIENTNKYIYNILADEDIKNRIYLNFSDVLSDKLEPAKIEELWNFLDKNNYLPGIIKKIFDEYVLEKELAIRARVNLSEILGDIFKNLIFKMKEKIRKFIQETILEMSSTKQAKEIEKMRDSAVIQVKKYRDSIYDLLERLSKKDIHTVDAKYLKTLLSFDSIIKDLVEERLIDVEKVDLDYSKSLDYLKNTLTDDSIRKGLIFKVGEEPKKRKLIYEYKAELMRALRREQFTEAAAKNFVEALVTGKTIEYRDPETGRVIQPLKDFIESLLQNLDKEEELNRVFVSMNKVSNMGVMRNLIKELIKILEKVDPSLDKVSLKRIKDFMGMV